MAVCVVLLAGATLCVRSLMNASAIDAGFDTHHIALTTVDPSMLGYSPAKVNEFYTRLLDHVQQVPGVTSASYTAFLPLGTSRSGTAISKQLGTNLDESEVDLYRISSGFFQTMGIPLLRGRDFTQRESNSYKADAVVINQTLANRLWPGEDPIGKHLAMHGEKDMRLVIGVVKDGKYHTLGEPPVAVMFLAELPPQRTIVVRTRGDSRTLLDEIQREVTIVDPSWPRPTVRQLNSTWPCPSSPREP